MATRRTRVKSIANIPQRRKVPETVPIINKDEPQEENVEQPVNEELNLTSDKAEEPQPQIAAPEQVSVKENEPEPPAKPQEDLLIVPVKESVTSLPVRRRFKAPAPVTSVRRKTKPENDQENNEPAAESPTANSNIIVLNEFIAHENLLQINGDGATSAGITAEKSDGEQEVQSGNSEKSFQSQLSRPDTAEERKLLISLPQAVNSDNESSVPPPSPSKAFNRTKFKPTPKVRQRHTSFSASESEDESRKNYRQRNDSVCSTASALQDSSTISECFSPQKPKEFSTIIKKKCRRTEQSRRLAEARRDFFMKFGNNKPDRKKLTMIDFIFYNPNTNQMQNEKRKKTLSETEADIDNPEDPLSINPEPEPEPEIADDTSKKELSDDENDIPAPQIKIGPQGEIVIDEKSLVIENKKNKKEWEDLQKSKLIDGNFETGYGIYKKAKRSKDWSKNETIKFYKALNTIGTDFTLMCELFPRRSRRELKMKFKKEERINKSLIDKAVMQPCGFDFDEFKHEVDMEEKELLEIEKQKERELQMKKEAKKRKQVDVFMPQQEEPAVKRFKEKKTSKSALDIMNVLDDSDADISEVDSESDTEDQALANMQRPTRYGRVPKIRDCYKDPLIRGPININRSISSPSEPGSLTVVASTNSDGLPVYKVFMVTNDHDKKELNVDGNVSSLSKAIDLQNNNGCIMQNVFTVTTTVTTDESANILENNITIPADETAIIEEEEEEEEQENNYTIPVENNITIPATENFTIPASE